MKRLTLLILTIFLAISANADERSARLLSNMARTIENSGNYRVNFTTVIEGDMAISGYYTVCGNDFYVYTPTAEIYCIDSIQYEIDDINREIVIERMNFDDEDILSNPVHAFSFMDKSYTHDFAGHTRIGNTQCDIISIKKRNGSDSITLYIDSETSLPLKAEYFVENINSDAVIDVTSFSANLTDISIRFDLKKYDGFEIIDFRK